MRQLTYSSGLKQIVVGNEEFCFTLTSVEIHFQRYLSSHFPQINGQEKKV